MKLLRLAPALPILLGVLTAQDVDVDPFQKLTPPVKLEATKIVGEGKGRKASLQLTNTGDKDIEGFVVTQFYLRADGSVGKDVRHPVSRLISGVPSNVLPKGQRYTVKIRSFFMKEDTAAVDGVISSLKFKDGTVWPPLPKTPAVRKNDEPVSAKMIGIVGEGVTKQPVVSCFNFGDKPITFVQYRIDYFDARSNKLGQTSFGATEDDPPLIAAGSGKNFVGGNKPPPAGAVGAEVTVTRVVFADKTTWKPAKD